MMSRIIRLCASILMLVTVHGFASAQDFKTKEAEVRKKANALIEKANKIIPPKVAGNMKDIAKSKGVPEVAMRAWLKAGGFFDPKFDGTQPSVVVDISQLSEKERILVTGKYMLAEHALAWRAVDPKFDYFLSPTEKNPDIILLRRSQLESAIEAIDFAKERSIFSGLNYAVGGLEVMDELKAVLKKLPD